MIKMVVLKRAGTARPGGAPSEYRFVRSRTYPLFLIGRDSTNDVVIAHPTISRSHLLIKVEADGTLLARDSGSRNGTWINSSRLGSQEWMVIPDGCEIRLGGVLLLLTNGGVEDTADVAALYDPERERRNEVLAASAYATELRNLPQTARFADIEASIQTHERFSRAQTMLLKTPEEASNRHSANVMLNENRANSEYDNSEKVYQNSSQAS